MSSELRNELRRAAAEPRSSLDTAMLMDRAFRRRRRRRTLVTVVGVCIVASIAITFLPTPAVNVQLGAGPTPSASSSESLATPRDAPTEKPLETAEPVAVWTRAPLEPGEPIDAAIISGTVSYDHEAGCFTLDGSPLVWPRSTRSSHEDATGVELADGQIVHVGDRISGPGGYYGIEVVERRDSVSIPRGCRTADGQVASFHPDSTIAIEQQGD